MQIPMSHWRGSIPYWSHQAGKVPLGHTSFITFTNSKNNFLSTGYCFQLKKEIINYYIHVCIYIHTLFKYLLSVQCKLFYYL